MTVSAPNGTTAFVYSDPNIVSNVNHKGTMSTLTITDANVLNEIAQSGVMKIHSASSSCWSGSNYTALLWLDNVKVSEAANYKVEHYVGETLVQTDNLRGIVGSQTVAEAKSLVGYDGFEAQGFEQATIAADGSTIVKIYYKDTRVILSYDFNDLALGAADTTKFYFSDNGTSTDTVTVNTFGYNEFVNNDTSVDEKAIKFYMSASTVRRYMYVNIVLTDGMKDALANGASISFAYAMNRCKGSQYTTYNLLAGANGGTTTQQLISASTVGYDSAGSTWGPRSTDSNGDTVSQWATLTITDATVLSELASTGVLQITLDACNWNKKHETNFWIDNIVVTPAN